jgi:hypothetical protein
VKVQLKAAVAVPDARQARFFRKRAEADNALENRLFLDSVQTPDVESQAVPFQAAVACLLRREVSEWVVIGRMIRQQESRLFL